MDVKLYCFCSGYLLTDKSNITMGRDIGKPYNVPVPFFLIQHPNGNVLYDTGMNIGVAQDKIKHWSEAVCSVYDPDMKEEDFCVNQLKKMGIEPEDINYVIQSHLHLDHAGGVGYFPNARYIVQSQELRWAFAPMFFQKGAYIKPDFDKPVDWMILYGDKDDDYDLFGDGSVRIWFSPGHTPGHQNVVVRTKNNGHIVLTGDSCYNKEVLYENVLPGLVWNCEETVKSVQRMLHSDKVWGFKVITGHDPESWETVKKVPEFYD